jgi:hypothetical protein
VAVLKVNFKHHGNCAEKIEKGEFAIEDAATRRDIDLTTNWELCFSPGQRVEMSIVAPPNREEFAIYQNVRYRYNDRRPSPASAERRYGQPGANLEIRKCRFCSQWFITSEDRRVHESLRTCYLSHFYLGVLVRSRALQHFSNASCTPSIKCEGLEILISRCK